MRRFGLRAAASSSDHRPAWERVSVGPLAGRPILIDRRGSGAWEDMLAGRFDVEIYDLVAKVLPAHAGIVWDVGAHIGFHTLGFSALAGQTGHVVGFEPNPANRQRLQRNLDKNPDLAARIEILSCGLSDQDGESVFAISPDVDSGTSSMSFLDSTTSWVDPATSACWDRVVVPVRTADSLIQEGRPSPHVIKIDVEGAELLVLRGAAAMMRVGRPIVIVETHSAKLVFEVHTWFQTQGYAVQLLADLAPSRVLLCARPA